MRRRVSKGLSELVVIMIAVAIAIPVMFILQSWLVGQMGRMPELDPVTATYVSRSVGADSLLVTLTVSNNGNEPVNVSSITVVYIAAGGGVSTTSGNLLGITLPQSINPKSSITIPLTINNAAKVNEVIVTVKIPGSDTVKTIRATGI
ncbi:MAG TPA: hypothetical protein VNL13_00390 [Sulfolobales archaeon]|nr:hypothetical protein [Sulfolobales archaeon]